MSSRYTADDFGRAGGWQRLPGAIARDKHVREAVSITGESIGDIAQRAVISLLESFEVVVAQSPADGDHAAYLVYAAVLRARDIARSVEHGYHTHTTYDDDGTKKVKPIRHKLKSDMDETGAFERLLSTATAPNTPNFADRLSPNTIEFARALYVQRTDLYDYLVLALAEDGEIGADRRKELGRAYSRWRETGSVPGVGRSGHAEIPAPTRKLRRVPADAEIVGLSACRRYVYWESDKLVGTVDCPELRIMLRPMGIVVEPLAVYMRQSPKYMLVAA